jgi:DNA-binding NarL/FixJ family response regulator
MSAQPKVSPPVAVILYEAYARISGRIGRDHHALYDYVRVVMSKITTVDSFYVGLLHDGNRVRFPYSFDGRLHPDPESHTFGQSGLTAWLLENKRTYRFDTDGGALLHQGMSFGDVRKSSADAVTVPMIRRTSGAAEVFGMLSMQSYTAGVYTEDSVAALEWLAEVVARLLLREQEDREALFELKLTIEDDPESSLLTSDQLVGSVVDQIRDLHRMAEEIATDAGATPERLRAVLRQLVDHCQRIQAELVEMTLLADDGPTRRFMSLTPAEQTIAILVADGLGPQQIADELRPTSTRAVRTHLRNIAIKYGMSQRAQIAADVRWHLSKAVNR